MSADATPIFLYLSQSILDNALDRARATLQLVDTLELGSRHLRHRTRPHDQSLLALGHDWSSFTWKWTLRLRSATHHTRARTHRTSHHLGDHPERYTVAVKRPNRVALFVGHKLSSPHANETDLAETDAANITNQSATSERVVEFWGCDNISYIVAPRRMDK